MARPNRNNREYLPKSEIPLKQKEYRTYRTAIYVRLSIADNRGHKDSIQNQILYLETYISKMPDLKLTACYQDNGVTGTHFQRPGLQAMMESVKRGEIDCIVVKDLSRLGRNYMETGSYLETIFPCLGIRFISVNDDYDSMLATGNELLALSLKNLAHHFYAADISEKIRTLLAIKKKSGVYLGRYGPYGYKKSAKNPHQLEIDEETASVVREIFSLRAKGEGAAKIARLFNDRGVLSPASRLCQMGLLKGSNGEKNALWSGSTILGILQNPVYCGYIVEQKTKQTAFPANGKPTRQKLLKDQWNWIEGKHLAIIDRETFLRVQDEYEIKRKRKGGKSEKQRENKLKGLIFCGICGSAMNRDQGYYSKKEGKVLHRYICGRKYKRVKGCTAPNVSEAMLVTIITELMDRLIMVLGCQEIWERLCFQNEKLTNSGNLPWDLYRSLVERILIFPKRVEISLTFCLPISEQRGLENVQPEKGGTGLWKPN